MEFLYNILIISLFCAGLKQATEPDMILSRARIWLSYKLEFKADWIYYPLIGCVYCYASLWGSVIYWLLEIWVWKYPVEASTWIMWPITCTACIYLNGLFYMLLKKIDP